MKHEERSAPPTSLTERRAALCAALGGLAFALSSGVRAQQAAKPKLVAQLGQGSPKLGVALLATVKQSLHELGWIEGKNIAYEYRAADGHAERLSGLAREIVALKPDVIYVIFTPAALALKDATTTIPVVANISDVVGAGLAQSLARPGSNFTGISNFNAELGPKLIELLRDARLPTLKRVGVLWNPDNASNALLVKHLRSGAASPHATVVPIEARTLTEIEQALSRMLRERVEAVVIAMDGVMIEHSQRIGELLVQYQLPAIAQNRAFLGSGVLMSYAINSVESMRRMAYYIDRILRGANPAELPIELPTRFELVISVKAAKMLGVTIPQSLLLRADEVVQ